MSRSKSILGEARQIEQAVALIELGARLQVLESETDMSYERLLRLYKEVAGRSPSKGQLPFSTDWFMTWQPNIHSSLFLNIHEYLNKVAPLDEVDAIIKAYRLYLEQVGAQGLEPLLSVTRAWRLVKFVDNGMLTMTRCSCCGGHFVTHPHEIAKHYVCGLCNPPARAGKGRSAGSLRIGAEPPEQLDSPIADADPVDVPLELELESPSGPTGSDADVPMTGFQGPGVSGLGLGLGLRAMRVDAESMDLAQQLLARVGAGQGRDGSADRAFAR
jgi:flagellar transcriptional activator FlhC